MAENLRIRIASLEKIANVKYKKSIEDGFNYIFRLDIEDDRVVANCFRSKGAKTEPITLGQFMSRTGSKTSVMLPTAPPDIQAEYDKYIAGKQEPLQVPEGYKSSTLLAVKLTKELAVN